MRFRIQNPDLPRAVYWFTGLAFALRLTARLCHGSAGFFESGYSFFFEMAQNIAAGKGISYGGVATAFRVPLYPIFLAIVTFGHRAFWSVAIAQSLIGAGTCLGASLLAQQIFGGQIGRKAAALTACIAAAYPYYVVHDTALQETSLFTLMTLLAVISLERASRAGLLLCAALSGFLLGLDVLTRATLVPFAAFAGLWLIGRKRTAGGLVCISLVAITVSPWLWRSYRLTGSPLLSTETGLQLWTGNNGYLFHHYPRESFDVSRAEAVGALTTEEQRELGHLSGNEALTDRWFRDRGLVYMKTHPWATVRDGVRKNLAAFGWLPTARRGRFPDIVHAFSYGPVMVLGLWGMWQRRSHWRDDCLIYGVFVTFIVTTAIFFGDTSHRSFLDVYWIVFGAGALVRFSLGALPLVSQPRRVESMP